MIDYKEEFLNLLRHNNIYNLPSQELIDTNKEVAKLVWKHYCPVSRYEAMKMDSEQIFDHSKWPELLGTYNQDIEFWTELLEEEKYDSLSKEYFTRAFPSIADYWLKDIQKLYTLFEKTGQNYFYKKIPESDEKDTYYKNHLMTGNMYKVSNGDILKYENDPLFVKELLEKQPSNYKQLNELNRKKHEFVAIALADKDNFNHIPLDYQQDPIIKNYWFKMHSRRFSLQEIATLPFEEKLYCIQANPDILGHALMNKFNVFKEVAIKLLEKDLDTFLIPISTQTLKSLPAIILQNKIIMKNLHDFISTYNETTNSGVHIKKIFLIEKIPELQKQAETNLFYILRNQKTSRIKFNKNEFDQFVTIIMDKNFKGETNSDDARKLLAFLRSVTEVEVLKQLPKTKDLLTYYSHQRLETKLHIEKDKKSILKMKL